MDKSICVLCLTVVALVSGCSSETAKRTAYETLQNVHEQECLKNPAMDCGKRGSYENYEHQRKSLELTN
ncbi:MAG: hypothetical protein ABI144_10065 [Gallionella sp.]